MIEPNNPRVFFKPSHLTFCELASSDDNSFHSFVQSHISIEVGNDFTITDGFEGIAQRVGLFEFKKGLGFVQPPGVHHCVGAGFDSLVYCCAGGLKSDLEDVEGAGGCGISVE